MKDRSRSSVAADPPYKAFCLRRDRARKVLDLCASFISDVQGDEMQAGLICALETSQRLGLGDTASAGKYLCPLLL